MGSLRKGWEGEVFLGIRYLPVFESAAERWKCSRKSLPRIDEKSAERQEKFKLHSPRMTPIKPPYSVLAAVASPTAWSWWDALLKAELSQGIGNAGLWLFYLQLIHFLITFNGNSHFSCFAAYTVAAFVWEYPDSEGKVIVLLPDTALCFHPAPRAPSFGFDALNNDCSLGQQNQALISPNQKLFLILQFDLSRRCRSWSCREQVWLTCIRVLCVLAEKLLIMSLLDKRFCKYQAWTPSQTGSLIWNLSFLELAYPIEP